MGCDWRMCQNLILGLYLDELEFNTLALFWMNQVQMRQIVIGR